MAKKVAEIDAELRKLLASDKLVLGTDETVKLLRQGKLQKVFFASNCSQSTKADLAQYCKLGEVECVELAKNNEEIGMICKKPFAISVVGVTA